MITGLVALVGVITWVKTGRHGDAKAVDVALVSTKSALEETATRSAKEFEGVRAEIKVLADAVAKGSASVSTAMKMLALLVSLVSVGGVLFLR